MNNNDYVRYSLELHLFFDRIMKEHSLFLEMAFVEKDSRLKRTARGFQKVFSDILKKVINLSDGIVSSNLLAANEIVTKNTLDAEKMTNSLLDENIDIDITRREILLRSGNKDISEDIVNKIRNINVQTLPLIKDLIKFKNDILNKVLSCKMYTANYPLLISHIMNEAKMYYSLLNKIESRTLLTKSELYEHELFWNDIMKEHAEFIRGLLDPSEKDLIKMADQFVKEYEVIIEKYKNDLYLTNDSLTETIKFRDFKMAGEEGILNCKVRSIIIPLLADHVVREANHFIRLLQTFRA